MAQPAQNILIRILLLWTTLLSIILAVFIILFFKAEKHGLFQNNSAVKASMQSPPLLSEVQMFAYKATEVNGIINWHMRNPRPELISEEGKNLTVKKDGYYFLNLQVTLKTSNCRCNGTRRSECMVKMTCNGDVLLQGPINTSTCSTGLLGKAVMLNSGSTLEFYITVPKNEIDESESLTHLDIIMLKI